MLPLPPSRPRPCLPQELRALFASIEAAEAAVGRVHAAAKAAADRLDALQKGYDTKYPEGLQARLGSWLGVRCVHCAEGGEGGGAPPLSVFAFLSQPSLIN
jgi:hypothetical protein